LLVELPDFPSLILVRLAALDAEFLATWAEKESAGLEGIHAQVGSLTK